MIEPQDQASGTPVALWAPAFRWLEELSVETTQSVFGGGVWCRLCERFLPWAAKARLEHVRMHRRERAAFEQHGERRRRREATERLRAVNRERRLARRAQSPGASERGRNDA